MRVYQNILNKFQKELDLLEVENEDILAKAEEGIKISKNALLNLRKVVINVIPKNKEKEIVIFKTIKPKIYSKLIYYVRLFNLESKRPRGSAKTQKKYLDYEIRKLQDYFNDNLEFYQYYRRGGTSLDNQYFVRGKEDIRLHSDNFHFFIDDKFSTSHDSTVATIIAYDMLIVYLQKEIELIEKKTEWKLILMLFNNNQNYFGLATKQI